MTPETHADLVSLKEKAARLAHIRRITGVITVLDLHDKERSAVLDEAWMELVPEICEAIAALTVPSQPTRVRKVLEADGREREIAATIYVSDGAHVQLCPEVPSLPQEQDGARLEAFHEDVTARTVAIMRDLYDLKEDVLFGPGVQPAFDGGMLEAADQILHATVDDEDPRVVAERQRRPHDRLRRVLVQRQSSLVGKEDGAQREGVQIVMTAEVDTDGQIVVSAMEDYRCFGAGLTLEAACEDFVSSLRDVRSSYLATPDADLTPDARVYRERLRAAGTLLSLVGEAPQPPQDKEEKE